MNILELLFLTIVVFICVYAVLDRICKCIESCKMAKVYCKYMDAVKNGNAILPSGVALSDILKSEHREDKNE